MVLVFLAVWRRPRITEICFMGLRRLINNASLPLKALAVVSEESMIPLCEKYGIQYTFYKNEPLGEKKNHGLNEAMKLQWDYLLEIGSDDILKDDILKSYKPFMESGEDMFGVKDAAYIDSNSGDCRRLISNTTYGCGRMISRKAIETCKGVEVVVKKSFVGNRAMITGSKGFFPKDQAEQLEKGGFVEIVSGEKYKLWNDEIMRGLDKNSGFFLASKGFEHKKVPCETALMIDIKSDENIWAYNPKVGQPYSMAEAMEGLSIEEQTAILNEIKRNNIEKQVTR